MGVPTDIVTGRPADESSKKDRVDEQYLEIIASAGCSDSHYATKIRKIVFEEILSRVRLHFQNDDVIKALMAVIQRIEIAEVKAEEVARALARNRA
jgi:hypothetical protein